MQTRYYQGDATRTHVAPGKMISDGVVGCFHDHNTWSDYQFFLFNHSSLTEFATRDMTALDFACGPGRNIMLFSDRFKKIDGVDISTSLLEKAKTYTSVLPEEKRPTLYYCNGLDLSTIPDASYDVVFSTIAFQHICCHSIRLGYLREFSRILKPGGYVFIQMGYGAPYGATRAVPYHANRYDVMTTNSGCDTRVENPSELEGDLIPCGFKNFEYTIRPPGPGDSQHPNWIFWSAIKA